MRLRIALPIAILAFPGSAAANPSFQGVLQLTGVRGDNLAVSDAGDGTGVPPEDMNFRISPGLNISYERPRHVHLVSTSLNLNLFPQRDEATSLSTRLNWNGQITPSKRSELTMGASVVYGRTNLFNVETESTTVTLDDLGQAGGSYLNAGLTEVLFHELSPTWRGMQAATLQRFILMSDAGDTTTDVLEGRLGADRTWKRDAAGLDLRLGHSKTNRPTGSEPGRIISGLVGRWRHVFEANWMARGEAGTQIVMRTDGEQLAFKPFAGAGAYYYREAGGGAELTYFHSTEPNVFLGEVQQVDRLRLRLGLPLGATGLSFATSAGYQRGRTILADGNMAEGVNVFIADAALSWRGSEYMTVALRYQLYNREADDETGAPSYVRNVFMVSVAARYPSDMGAELRYPALLRMVGQGQPGSEGAQR
ncbi:MAG: hypothetical protein HY698_01965 [Deltaproteobacteria bacterium]|nr:hypothetical protein [Deltaproteobacteria bacterium]